MSTLQGTAIKNTGYLDKVYFNTSLSTEEVIAILEKLDLSKDYFVCTRLAAPQISVWVRKRENYYSIICQRTPYIDMPFNTDPQNVNETSGIVKTGWKTSFDNEGFGNPFEIQDEIDSADYQGNAIGSQNELLKNLISSTPFVESSTLDEFLTDLADSIRYVKGTEEKVNAQNYSSEIRKFKGGGGSSTHVDNGAIYEGKYRVRYFDADGTVLKIEYVESGGKTTPPDKPSYDPDYLIFAEWNYDTDNYIVEQPTDIGAIYDTVDDATYMFCRFTKTIGLKPTLGLYLVFTSIDWGDGTVDTNVSHTYANEGDYVIKIYGDISFNTSSSKYLLGSTYLNKALRKCFIKNSVTSIENFTFQYCNSLTSITIPKSVTSIGENAFSECYSLTSISIPKGITSIKSGTYGNCKSLNNISIPKGVTSIGYSAFQYCFSLTSITIPKGVTKIESGTFDSIKVTSITIPKGVTNIANTAFKGLYTLTNCFIECDTIPTLASTNAFTNINYSAIFWVNDSIIEQLKVATNWSTYASYMKPLSWYPSLTDPNA